MIQYDSSEEEYVDYPSEVESKRKHLSQYDDRYMHGLTSEGIVEVTAWAFVGGVGVILALGATMVALTGPQDDAAVMLVPLMYMIGVMIFMRRRR